MPLCPRIGADDMRRKRSGSAAIGSSGGFGKAVRSDTAELNLVNRLERH